MHKHVNPKFGIEVEPCVTI